MSSARAGDVREENKDPDKKAGSINVSKGHVSKGHVSKGHVTKGDVRKGNIQKSHETPQGAEDARRPSWLGFFMEEWGLLLLAATMTFGSWWIVREQVVKVHRIDDIRILLEVDPKVRDRIGAVLTEGSNTISIVLNCSEREKNEAINALKRTGIRSVTLRILDVPAEETRSLTKGVEVFDWPFDDERILDPSFRMPAGTVFRISPRKVEIAIPATVRTAAQLRAQDGIKVDIDPQKRSVLIAGPEGVFDTPLVPDEIAINPAEFALRDDGSYEGPRRITLTFSTWRDDVREEPWLRVYKREVTLEEVSALVSLTQVVEIPIGNHLLVLADRSRFEFDFSDLRLEEPVSTRGALTFEGRLRGPKRVLDELAKESSKSAWAWGIRLKQDPDAEFRREGVQPDEHGWLSLDAEIEWLPYGEYQNRGVVHEPVGFEKEFTYKVRIRKP